MGDECVSGLQEMKRVRAYQWQTAGSNLTLK